MQHGKTNRRTFLTAAAVTSLAPFVSRLSWAQGSPMQKVQHAAIAAGGKGRSDINEICKHDNVELIAAADTSTAPLEKLKEAFPNARHYSDWRDMLMDLGDQIDTVSVSTPDHTHGIAAMSAMNLGKHVYCQKPLVQTVLECRQMLACAEKNGVVVQMGTQMASSFYDRMSVHLIQNEAVGKIKEAWVFSHKQWGDVSAKPNREDPVPEGLDWDGWLSVAAMRPYIGDGYYHPGNWRKRQDFGTGTLGDMGCHIFSSLYNGLELTLPHTLRSETRIPNEDNWAYNEKVEYWFPKSPHTEDEIKVTWVSGDRRAPKRLLDQIPQDTKMDQGYILEGENGLLLHRHGGSRPLLFPQEDYAGVEMPKFEPLNHYHAFVDAVIDGDRSRLKSPIERAAPLTEFIVLGNIATRFTWKKLAYDAEHARITNHNAANQYLSREYRDGWKILGA